MADMHMHMYNTMYIVVDLSFFQTYIISNRNIGCLFGQPVDGPVVYFVICCWTEYLVDLQGPTFQASETSP